MQKNADKTNRRHFNILLCTLDDIYLSFEIPKFYNTFIICIKNWPELTDNKALYFILLGSIKMI